MQPPLLIPQWLLGVLLLLFVIDMGDCEMRALVSGILHSPS